MTNKILINDASGNETRIAIVTDGELVDFDLQSDEHFRTKSNIYLGVVTRVEPSLEAVFVNYGETKNGFLPVKEINSEYLSKPYRRQTDIRDLVEIGQEMIVQVVKEARKDKGAALTTFVTISSRSVVLNRGHAKKINISRNITGENRSRIEKIVQDVGVPDGFAAIVRTAAMDISPEEMEWDINYLKRMWDEVQQKAQEISEPALIIRESDVITRTIRDKFNDTVDEVVVDSTEAYETVKKIVSQAAPKLLNKISLYDSDISLFTHYGVEKTVQSAFKHIVNLPSGGQLVIDRTEAMFIIDVNSSQSNKGKSVEDTALTNNLEAVTEITRQMRLRDIGGLMVIDFIDMMRSGNKTKVETAFRDEAKKDKAYVRMSSISKFGMMEVSRQRLRSSLDEFYLTKCPRCNGSGTIFTPSAMTSEVFRTMSDFTYNSLIRELKCVVPSEILEMLNSSYGEDIAALDKKYPGKTVLEADDAMMIPHYKIVYTDVNGSVNEYNEYNEDAHRHQQDYTSDEDVNREPLMSDVDVLHRAPPNKNKNKSLGKIVNLIGGWFKSESAEKEEEPRRRSRRRGRYSSSRKEGSAYRGGRRGNRRNDSRADGRGERRSEGRGDGRSRSRGRGRRRSGGQRNSASTNE